MVETWGHWVHVSVCQADPLSPGGSSVSGSCSWGWDLTPTLRGTGTGGRFLGAGQEGLAFVQSSEVACGEPLAQCPSAGHCWAAGPGLLGS